METKNWHRLIAHNLSLVIVAVAVYTLAWQPELRGWLSGGGFPFMNAAFLLAFVVGTTTLVAYLARHHTEWNTVWAVFIGAAVVAVGSWLLAGLTGEQKLWVAGTIMVLAFCEAVVGFKTWPSWLRIKKTHQSSAGSAQQEPTSQPQQPAAV
jgi:uncharacterized membrane protein YfcA